MSAYKEKLSSTSFPNDNTNINEENIKLINTTLINVSNFITNLNNKVIELNNKNNQMHSNNIFLNKRVENLENALNNLTNLVNLQKQVEVEVKEQDARVFDKVVVVEGVDYRVPSSVIGNLKAILEKKPSMTKFSVARQGKTKDDTKYTVIPLD